MIDMADLFVGDLSIMKLFDLLKPLLVGKKTGMVLIKGKEVGEIYLEAGNIVHVNTAHSFGEDAFFIMMGWKMGRATFDPNTLPKEKNDPHPLRTTVVELVLPKTGVGED